MADGSTSWPTSHQNRRPSDYESKSLRPAGVISACSGCSGQRGRPASVFLTCRVTARGMTNGMTRPTHEGPQNHGRPSDRDRKVAAPTGKPTFRRRGLMVGQEPTDTESDDKASNSKTAQPVATRTASGSMLSRVDQDGRIPDRSHTRGLSGTSRRSTPGLDRRSAAKRSPSSTPR